MEKLSAEGYSEFDDQRQSRLDAELSASDFYQFSEKPLKTIQIKISLHDRILPEDIRLYLKLIRRVMGLL
jgi:hypothetical protein